ncbi:MAG TPA: c-type cytochrome [Pirellulales bacterium]|nr:c-type cytochrome [Pirellulales bacterium]
MAQPHNSNPKLASREPTRTVEMPRPTVWPVVLGLGIVLAALGVATSLFFCIVGATLLVIGLVGWVAQLMPGRGHEHEPLAAAEERVTMVIPRPGTVEQLKPGVTGYRFQVPEKVHPVSAGMKGGIVGGLLMPIPALVWAVASGHSIWYPVNLLAGLVLPGLPDMSGEQLQHNLEIFHPGGVLCAIIMHVMMSIGFGLIGGVLLPMLPSIRGAPLLFGGLILPLLWSGANHSLMGLVNPLLNEYINWPWYVVSQLVYGIATSIVIIRSEKIAIAPRGSGRDAGGPFIPPGWLGCLLMFCVLFSGCSDALPGKPALADAYVMPQDIKNFSGPTGLYAQRCAGCHGADGTLGPGPPLNDPLFLALVSDDELRSVIAEGRRGTLMPAWAQSSGGPLTADQVMVLVKGIRAWQTPANTHVQRVYPSAPPLAAPTAKGMGNFSAGEKVYAAACADCHGEHGEGTEDTAGPLNDPAFLALCSDQELRRYIITGRPDLGMPDFASASGRGEKFYPLTADQVNDLMALLKQWREIATTE